MDYYKTMNNLKQLFIKFIEKTPSFGKSFICLDDKNNKEIVKKLTIKIIIPMELIIILNFV